MCYNGRNKRKRGGGAVGVLDTEVQFIKGVGEQRAKAFAKLGVETLRDLVMAFPRAYDDRTAVKTIAELQFGEMCCVSATVAAPARLSRVRKGLDITKCPVVDETARMTVTFFNQSYVGKNLIPGESYIFYGRVGGRIGAPEMQNPVMEREALPPAFTRRIVPVYRMTAGLSQRVFANAVRQGLEKCGEELPEQLPESVRKRYQLAQTRFSYENIHFPRDAESLELARRRLIFEEFFVLSCTLAFMRSRQREKSGKRVRVPDMAPFYKALPYALTGAQQRAVDDILRDLAGERPMSRLVQGDVGSGKTAVAAAAAYAVVQDGRQAAFMAPTEILAEQHYHTLTELLTPLGVRVGLLTGGLTAKRKREEQGRLKSGETQLVIGTHALLSESVEFADLGLIIADEQHRFGVQQRAALSDKGDAPHVLVMSATPIPRTLALIVYGDLDVSVINELPPGRRTVETYLVGEDKRQRLYAFVRKHVAQGRQVFMVCPAVEESEENPDGLKSVKEYAKELSEKVFPDLRVALVHGKLKPKEKNEVMASFAAGDIDILVATTVIEVGVDVPNATLMVVENADRFGLSQLHQLRGRVGRGPYQSTCVLIRDGGGEAATERLRAFCRTNDGFKIAEEDLAIRGPGDFFGSRQSGLPDMNIASFATDLDMLRSAQAAAKELLEDDPGLAKPENAPLRESVSRMLEKNRGTLN